MYSRFAYNRLEVVDAAFVREDKHKWVQHSPVLEHLLSLILDMNSNEVLHVLVLTLVLPVLLVFVGYIKYLIDNLPLQ